jgi:hypothetical protein
MSSGIGPRRSFCQLDQIRRHQMFRLQLAAQHVVIERHRAQLAQLIEILEQQFRLAIEFHDTLPLAFFQSADALIERRMSASFGATSAVTRRRGRSFDAGAAVARTPRGLGEKFWPSVIPLPRDDQQLSETAEGYFVLSFCQNRTPFV